MNLLEIMLQGGWLMIPILLSSIAVIAIGIGRFLILKKANNELKEFLNEWFSAPLSTDPIRLRSACQLGPASVGTMSEVFDSDKTSVSKRMDSLETSARGEIFDLERGLGTLATLAGVTPLIGFLGTVTGMISAFMQIQNLGGNVNANVLAGGIWEALVTTAAGLAVGILALVIHNYLSYMVRLASRQLEQCSEILTKILGKDDEAKSE